MIASEESSLNLSEFFAMRYSAGGHAITRIVSQRIGAVIAWLGARLGVTPNVITLFGSLVFLSAATLFAALPPGWSSAFVCLVMFQLGYGVDCADGQLARATGRTSRYGAWLDIACDYFRNVVLGAAVAAWLIRNGLHFGIGLVVAALFTAGAAIQLHTVTVIRQTGREARLQTQGIANGVRAMLTAFFDTATVLLILSLLRVTPTLLAAYVAGLGFLYLAVATYQAHKRLRG